MELALTPAEETSELVHVKGDEACALGTHSDKKLRSFPDNKWSDCARNLLKRVTRSHVVLVAVLIIVTAVIIAWIAVLKRNQYPERQILTEVVQMSVTEDGKDSEVLPPCGNDWIRYQNKCFYFSEAEGTWTEAKDACAALDSTLAVIDTQQELDFMLRHKGDPDRWIGLRRNKYTQPWIWVDGTEFNNGFKVADFAECAYLNHGRVKSAECYSKRKWSCSKMAP